MIKTLVILAVIAGAFFLLFPSLRLWGGLDAFDWKVQSLVCLLLIGLPLSFVARSL